MSICGWCPLFLIFTALLLPGVLAAQSSTDHPQVKIILEDDTPATDAAIATPEVNKNSEQKPDKRPGVPSSLE